MTPAELMNIDDQVADLRELADELSDIFGCQTPCEMIESAATRIHSLSRMLIPAF